MPAAFFLLPFFFKITKKLVPAQHYLQCMVVREAGRVRQSGEASASCRDSTPSGFGFAECFHHFPCRVAAANPEGGTVELGQVVLLPQVSLTLCLFTHHRGLCSSVNPQFPELV